MENFDNQCIEILLNQGCTANDADGWELYNWKFKLGSRHYRVEADAPHGSGLPIKEALELNRQYKSTLRAFRHAGGMSNEELNRSANSMLQGGKVNSYHIDGSKTLEALDSLLTMIHTCHGK